VGRQIQSFLLDGSHARSKALFIAMPPKVAPQAATDGHVGRF
jgi:hypothetical protein